MARQRRRKGAGFLKSATIEDLNAELMRRRRGLPRLLKKRDGLMRRVDTVNAQIAELGGEGGGWGGRGRRGGGGAIRGRRRAKNSMSLVEALSQVLKGKTMSVTAVSDAVQKAGYKTHSKTFRTIVNQALINSGKFKRLGRGEYTLKG